MKKKTEKKLQLTKIKIANLNESKHANRNIISLACSIGCQDLSQGAHICSDDSCRF